MKNEIKDNVKLYIRLGRSAGPRAIGGTTSPMPVKNGEGYLVWINTVHGEKRAAASWLHEALHIYHGDFDDPRPVAEIEAERRAELRELLQILIKEDEENDGRDDWYETADAEDMFQGRYHLHSITKRKEPPVCVAGDSQGRTENAEVGLNNSARTFHYNTEVV